LREHAILFGSSAESVGESIREKMICKEEFEKKFDRGVTNSRDSTPTSFLRAHSRRAAAVDNSFSLMRTHS